MGQPFEDIRANLVSLPQLCILFAVILLLGGCSRVTIEEMGLVSQPNMQFEENQPHGLNNALLPQIEPGNNASGGAQSAGCIACK